MTAWITYDLLAPRNVDFHLETEHTRSDFEDLRWCLHAATRGIVSEVERPEFENPPVIEVVCGVAFPPVPGFTIAHVGRWWDELGEEFQQVDEVPPLAVVIEGPGPHTREVFADAMPIPRMWFTSSAGDRLVQLQRDRFLTNWRKTSPDHTYPRYDRVSSDFFDLLSRFEQFCETHADAKPDLKQYELSYINHLPQGEGWDTLGNIGNVFPDLSWRDDGRFLPSPEGLDARIAFALPEDAGRLHIRLQVARRRQDNQPILVLDLTARGFLPDTKKWFGLAHEWIVRGFADFTGDAVQKDLWGRTE